jgi:glycosyltransferase involved in cell wall biosynthesis
VSLDNETGFTVEPRNTQALSSAINKIISDPNLKLTFSHLAKKRAGEFFSKEIFLKTNQKYFEEAMK